MSSIMLVLHGEHIHRMVIQMLLPHLRCLHLHRIPGTVGPVPRPCCVSQT